MQPLRRAGFGVEQHAVGLDSHDCPGVGGEEKVRDLGEHGVGEVCLQFPEEFHDIAFEQSRHAEGREFPGLASCLENHPL